MNINLGFTIFVTGFTLSAWYSIRKHLISNDNKSNEFMGLSQNAFDKNNQIIKQQIIMHEIINNDLEKLKNRLNDQEKVVNALREFHQDALKNTINKWINKNEY